MSDPSIEPIEPSSPVPPAEILTQDSPNPSSDSPAPESPVPVPQSVQPNAPTAHELEAFAVPSLPAPAMHYIPNFITPAEEAYLLRKIDDSPKASWKVLQKRRVQNYGGEVTPSNHLIPSPLPSFLTDFPHLVTRIAATGAFASTKHQRPNYVLVNEYLPGEGIMPHTDGPAYAPVVATLSLGSHALMDLHPPSSPSSPPTHSLLLEPRSLILTSSTIYSTHLHAIPAATHDRIASPPGQIANAPLLVEERYRRFVEEGGVLARGRRVSLGFRDVEKVAGKGVGKALGGLMSKK